MGNTSGLKLMDRLLLALLEVDLKQSDSISIWTALLIELPST